jgi:hypothetical protein
MNIRIPIQVSISAAVGMVTLIAFIITAVTTIEGRYLKTEEFRTFEKNHEIVVAEIHKDHEKIVYALRMQHLEDRLFELRLLQNPTTSDKALIRRYQEELLKLHNHEPGWLDSHY